VDFAVHPFSRGYEDEFNRPWCLCWRQLKGLGHSAGRWLVAGDLERVVPGWVQVFVIHRGSMAGIADRARWRVMGQQ
jgi:hypothetical protein